MNFVVHNMLIRVKKDWETLIKNSGIDDIYRSYEFFRICLNYRISSVSNIKKRNIISKFIVCFENGVPKCIAPLIFDNTPQKSIRLLGHGTNAGTLDFIYDANDKEYAAATYKYIRKKYPEYSLEFYFVPSLSPLCRMMERTEEFNNYDVYIETYESFFSSLSKSTRQNIRTSYNRLTKDGKEYQLKIYGCCEEGIESIIKEANMVYQRRRLVWEDSTVELSPKTIYKIYKRDVVYQTMRKLSSSKIVCLFIDGQLAAFFMGYEYDNQIRIPRLAIDDAYSRYSPGMILICEYLKQSPENFHFDLGRGDESYKSKLNGMVYKTYNLSNKHKV